MGKSHARAARVSLEGVSGVVYDKARYQVSEPMDLPTLRRCVTASPHLQKAIRAVCDMRVKRFEGKAPYERSRTEPQKELAFCCRAALLLGDDTLFSSLYAQRVDRHGGYIFGSGISPDEFWQVVLGEKMAGSALVPEGPAREEIVRLEALWYALSSSPAGRAQGKGVCGVPSNEYLQVTAALRACDKGALQELVAQGSSLAKAGCAMLDGRWGEASQDFEQTLGWTQRDLLEVQHGDGAPLLAFASLCNVLGQGKVRTLDAWLRVLTTELECGSQPVFLRETSVELQSFCYHLKAVDGLLNRKSSLISSVRSCHAFGCFPLVLAYSVLPDYIRVKLPVGLMAKAVDILSQDGHVLLAAYGAAALLQEEELPTALSERLEEVASAAGGVVLPSGRGASATESFLTELEQIAQAERGLQFLQHAARGGRLAEMQVERKQQGIRISLSARERMSIFGGSVYKAENPFLYTIRKYAKSGTIMLNSSAALRLSALSVEMLSEVEMRGSLLPPLTRSCAAQPRAVLVLQVLGGLRVLVSLRMSLLPESTPLFVAAYGLEVPLVERAGESVAVRRNMPAEQALCKAAVDKLNLNRAQKNTLGMQGGALLLELPELFSLLESCRAAQIPLFWRGEQRLRFYHPTSALNLRVANMAHDWLEVGADLQVDEDKVIELSTLIAGYGKRNGHYMQIGEDEYMYLSEKLERQLALLSLSWQKKGKSHGMHRGAWMLLESLDADAAKKPHCSSGKVVSRTLPAGLRAELRPYQKDGFEWLAERSELGIGAFLADDMGLGKTVQMLALLLHEAERPGADASLVVVPVSLLGNWAAEAARFAPSLRVIIYDPKCPETLKSLAADHLVLVSYGQLSSHVDEFAARSWNVMVLDEAQAIKTPESQRSRAVCELKTRMRFALTGTPIENSLMDLWSEMRFLNPGLFGSREQFSRRFARSEARERDMLRRVLAPLVLRRTKEQVLKQLPELMETQEWVEFSGKERALYESIRRDALKKLREEGGGGISMLASLTRLRRACCHGRLALDSFSAKSAKLERMLELVEELKEEGRRALIFSQFTDVLDLVEPLLNTSGISWLRLDGSTPAARRSKLVQRFQEGEADVFLISLKAGGVGLNLTAADYVLLLDPWWNPAVEEQAASRAHRMGQQNPVTVCRLVVRGTVEERILQLQREKKELAESILATGGKGVSLELLRSLLAD